MKTSPRPDTLITHAGRHPETQHGIVNPAVYHASTVLFPNLGALDEASHNPDIVRYGRVGTPTSRAFEDAVAALEGGFRAVTMPSGLAAIATTLMALVRAGDHILVSDSVYGPTRTLCEQVLKKFGVVAEYYDPRIGDAIARLFRPETRLVFLESPGSYTFEIQDVPAIAAVAKARGALVVMDNTWATPLFFRPFDHGVDVSVHAATKYLVGHSDAMMGIAVANEASYPRLRQYALMTGTCAGPDDLYLAQRGLRTLGVRLRQHQATGIALAQWLRARPEIVRVLHPALPDDPGHALWQRDFRGASGLFGAILAPCTDRQLAAFFADLALFGIGYSWGGYESLMLPAHLSGMRTVTTLPQDGILIRLHAGLEDPQDLIEDLERAFARLAAAR
ncbi:MAG: cystathionine beta-lyase [Azospirillaceae bacterium]|nr:cystathionine beta-lyase [Azospirillaceae bacterium]